MKQLLFFAITLVVLGEACKKDNKATVPVLTTTAPTGVTATSAATGGDITSTGGSTISQSGICWAFQDNPTVGDSLISSGQTGTGVFTVSMTNLNANTTYYVRAFAINNLGTAYGIIDSFTTSPGLATVVTTAVSNIVPLTAYSGGSVTNNGGSSVTARGICWSTSANPTISNLKTSDSTGIGSFTDSLTDLASQTVYYVRAYATNSSGTAYGNQITFTSSSANTVTDIDGNVYPYVVLGTQSWMTMNLRTSHFQNGDAITDGLTNYMWATSTTGAFTYPNGDSTTNAQFGKLYDAYAVNDSRNACPVGWHIPTDAEWQTLEFYEGMTPADTGTTNSGPRGTIGATLLVGGVSGLNLNDAGLLFPGNGAYYYFDMQGYYYSSTPAYNSSNQYLGNYFRAFNTVSGDPGPIDRNYVDYGMSVRCIEN
jgi:uncharacterized protein (TIGR02145 family)